MHLARAREQRGARGEDRRAAHAGVAAEHGEAAERALVRRERARGQRVREPCGRVQHDRRRGGRRELERRDVDFAGQIAAVDHVQARLRADESQRVRRDDGRAAADDLPRIAVEPARHVEREHRAAASRMLGDACRLRGEDAVERAAEPDAEQPVDDPRIAVQRRGRLGRDRHAGRACDAECPLRVVGLDGHRHPRVRGDAELLQPRGRDECVAAVVAGADGEPDRTAAAAGARGEPVRGGRAGAVHQRMRGQGGGRGGFGGAQIGDAQQRDRVGIGERVGERHGDGSGTRREPARGGQVVKRSARSAASVSAGQCCTLPPR
ncbi:hypothetical protein FEP76_05364 [Burkholderia multivorans]|nr:hypothetical protein [Burkholderia multivorans]